MWDMEEGYGERMWRSGEDFGYSNAYLLLSARHRMIRPGARIEKR